MRIIPFATVTSTQDIAKSFIANREELVIWAKEQKRGRGRFEREWYSPPGGLYFSLLLFPRSSEILTIHLKLFWATIKGIKDLVNLLPFFKWPNDIVYDGKKLGGILLEMEKDAIIAGCGINVNNEIFPEYIKDAISLKSLLKREIPIEELLQSIIARFQNCPNFATILSEIRKRNFLKGKYIVLNSHRRRIKGTAMDIDEEGRLILQKEEGGLLTLSSGEIEKVYEYK